MERSGVVLFTFSSKIVQGQSWQIFKCHICSVIWQTRPLLLPPNCITWWDGGSLTCFATAWWVTWQDEEHNIIIRVSRLSFFLLSPSSRDNFMLVGRCCAGSRGKWHAVPEQAPHTRSHRADPVRAVNTARFPHPDRTAASLPRGKTTFRAEKVHQASSGVWPLLLHLHAKTSKILKLENSL